TRLLPLPVPGLVDPLDDSGKIQVFEEETLRPAGGSSGGRRPVALRLLCEKGRPRRNRRRSQKTWRWIPDRAGDFGSAPGGALLRVDDVSRTTIPPAFL